MNDTEVWQLRHKVAEPRAQRPLALFPRHPADIRPGNVQAIEEDWEHLIRPERRGTKRVI